MYIISIQPSATELLFGLLQTKGLNGHFASFFETKDLLRLATTCKTAHKSLASDEVWEVRLKRTEMGALLALRFYAEGSSLYARYAQFRIYQRSGDAFFRFLHPTREEMFNRHPSLLYTPVIAFLNAPRDDVAHRLAHLMIMFSPLIIDSLWILGGSKEEPIALRYLNFFMMTYMHQLPLFQFLWSAGLSRPLGGHVALLKHRVQKAIAPPLTRCLQTTQRVTSCWQAFSRGVARCFQTLRGWIRPHHD